MKAEELLSQYQSGRRNFQGIDLQNVNFAWVDLSEIDLKGANLQHVNFSAAILKLANFETANLAFADLSRADLTKANLGGANLKGAVLDGTKFEDNSYNNETLFPKGFDLSIFLNGSYLSVPSKAFVSTHNFSESVQGKIEEIDKFSDLNSHRYGRLLNWQNPPDPFWHYGIGLSDTHIFDTGAGLCPFERCDAKAVMGIEHIVFASEQTIERLKQALCVFENWDYSFLGWNCEHFGRLIATDEPKCYQSSILWWLSDQTPDGQHKTAYFILHDHLRKVAPHLNRSVKW